MPPVVRFPTKPPHRIVRIATAIWKGYERHQFDVALALLAVSLLCIVWAQIADAFERFVP